MAEREGVCPADVSAEQGSCNARGRKCWRSSVEVARLLAIWIFEWQFDGQSSNCWEGDFNPFLEME